MPERCRLYTRAHMLLGECTGGHGIATGGLERGLCTNQLPGARQRARRWRVRPCVCELGMRSTTERPLTSTIDDAAVELIVAVAQERVIGLEGGHLGLPWHIPEDLKHFKKRTLGHTLIMGRKTHEAIGRALPRRRNLVLTRSGHVFEGCESIASLSEAIETAHASGERPIIAGGASVYKKALATNAPYPVTTIHLTEVDRAVAGDAFFPTLGPEFKVVERRAGKSEGITFVTLVRVN